MSTTNLFPPRLYWCDKNKDRQLYDEGYRAAPIRAFRGTMKAYYEWVNIKK